MDCRYSEHQKILPRSKRSLRKPALLLLLSILLLSLPSVFAAAESPEPADLPTFASVARLDLLQQALNNGAEIVSAVYSDGTAGSGIEFTTTDPDEADELWKTVCEIEIADETTAFITDWYPSIWFHLSDNSSFGVFFDGHNLDMGQKLYELENDEAFWNLTAELGERYQIEYDSEPEEGEPIPNVVDLYFPSNPTTGYTWSAQEETEGIVEVSGEYFPDSSLLGFTGAGGTQWYHFAGISEGITSVTFVCERPWEAEALYSFTYRLSVDEDLNVLIWGVEMSEP